MLKRNCIVRRRLYAVYLLLHFAQSALVKVYRRLYHCIRLSRLVMIETGELCSVLPGRALNLLI